MTGEWEDPIPEIADYVTAALKVGPSANPFATLIVNDS